MSRRNDEMPSPSSTDSNSNAILSAMPAEVLQEIFQNLSYITLKAIIPLVCRRFQAIISEATSKARGGLLAEALFYSRLSPSVAAREPKIFAVHPCFERLFLRREVQAHRGVNINLGTVGFQTRSGFVPIRDSPIATENATSGAVAAVYFDIIIVQGSSSNKWAGECIKNEQGGPVTVLQVLESLMPYIRVYDMFKRGDIRGGRNLFASTQIQLERDAISQELRVPGSEIPRIQLALNV